MLPTIHLLATGGTIAGAAGSSATTTQYAAGALGVDALLAAVPALASIACVQAAQIASIDSRNAAPRFWQETARAIQAAVDDPTVDGVVLTHGTDTLEETAWYLHLTLKTHKPVVITAAMRPATSLSADGPLNLLNAVRVAIDKGAVGRGVLVAVNHQVFGARGVRKGHTMRPDAFAAEGLLGQVHDDNVDWAARPQRPHTLDTPFTPDTPLPEVDVLVAYAGASPRLIDAARASGARGIVWAGTGNGTASDDIDAALDAAAQAGVAVVRASRVAEGPVRHVSVPYGGSVDAGWLSPYQARVLLMLSLGAGLPASDAFARF